MEMPFLRTLVETFFTIFPSGFFLQVLDVYADIFNFLFGLIGIETNIVGF